MQGFRRFFKDAEQERDVAKTIAKLPPKHRALVKGFTFHFEPGHTLDRHPDSVGLVVDGGGRKAITVASPWFYAREFSVLHEIAHLVWRKYADEDFKKEWKRILAASDISAKDRQNDEEMFAMAYAGTYAKRPPAVFQKKEWIDFVKKMG